MSVACFNGEHYPQDLFHGHGMAAKAPFRKEAAGAAPLTAAKNYIVITVLTAEFDCHVLEGNPIGFFSVPLGFFNFSNQTGLHGVTSFNYKSTDSAENSALILTDFRSFVGLEKISHR
jgi:hypothetical protein